MNFKRGEKVVLITGCSEWERTHPLAQGLSLPSIGEVYTVREVCARGAIRLQEIVNPPRDFPSWGYMEAFFNAECFRRVVEKKKAAKSSKGMEILNSIRDGGHVSGREIELEKFKQREIAQ
jgi:hypothetical protein